MPMFNFGGPQAQLPATAAPGTIMRGPDGQNYQFAQTSGMMSASGAPAGGTGWIQTNTQPRGGFLQQLLAPENAMPIAAALMGQQGNGQNFSNAMSAYGQTAAQTAGKNKTLDFFRKQAPEFAQMVEAGMPVNEAWQTYTQQRYAKPAANPFGDRAAAAQQYGLDPNSEEGRNFVLSGDLPARGNNDFANRQQAASQFGLQPDDPAYRSYVLTGKMPREDQAPLTATDKKAILEADEMVQTSETALPLLDRALELNDKAYDGPTAGARGWLTGNLGYEGGAATMEFDNLIQQQALATLKATFGAAPTEGERKILLEIAGSSSQPAAVRKGILERAKQAVTRRQQFYRDRAGEMRGGSFYKPGGDQPASGWQDVGNGVKIRRK